MINITLNFQVLGLNVTVPVKKVDELTYNYPIPRELPLEMVLNGSEYTMNVSKKEFIEEITFLLPNSLDEPLEQVAFESLYQIIVRHINKYKRILPVDLDSYIGKTILLHNSILKAQNKQMLSKKEQEEMFAKFNYMAFGMLPENLKLIYRTPF